MNKSRKFILSTLLLGSMFLAGCNSDVKVIHTDNAPQAIGPYSQATVVDGMVYCSGQIALDPTTNKLVEGDIAAQTHQVMKNLKAVLEAAGSSLEKVTKTTIFLVNLDYFSDVNNVYATYFGEGHYPARSCVEVSELPKGALVEIEAIATVK